MNILLLKANKKDEDFLLKMRKSEPVIHPKLENLYITPQGQDAVEASFQNTYVIRDYIQPIGLLEYIETANTLGIIQFELLPEFQNKGIGNYVVKILRNIGQVKKKTLSLKILKSSPSSSFYSRNGFKIVAQGKEELLMQLLP